MRIGIIGYPNVGKSTLFNALTGATVPVANYPFTTVERNVGIVPLPDERLHVLDSVLKPAKLSPATINFVDIAGLVKGASKGEGLGNRFLAHVREVDCLIHVVRAFKDLELVHVHGRVDPVSDIDSVNLELYLADIDVLDRRIEKIRKQHEARDELALLRKIRETLERGDRPQVKSSREEEYLRGFSLLTVKPCLYVLNMDEEDLTAGDFEELRKVRSHIGEQEAVPICVKDEYELSLLDPTERAAMRRALGLESFSLDTIVDRTYNMLNLIRFYTVKGDETRAWTLPEGSTVLDAAYRVHTEMGEKFIRAEVYSYDELIECGSQQVLRERGLIRTEGKDYTVSDGDIVLIKFGP